MTLRRTATPIPAPSTSAVGFNLSATGPGWPDFIAPCTATYTLTDLNLVGKITTGTSSYGTSYDTKIVLHNAQNLQVGDTFETGDFDAYLWKRTWAPAPKGSRVPYALSWLWGYNGGTSGQITVEEISGMAVLLRVTNLSVIT
ncbi:MAG: hypothetical protein EOP84_35030, partial [Verrucomicrobiaceae bacterium]